MESYKRKIIENSKFPLLVLKKLNIERDATVNISLIPRQEWKIKEEAAEEDVDTFEIKEELLDDYVEEEWKTKVEEADEDTDTIEIKEEILDDYEGEFLKMNRGALLSKFSKENTNHYEQNQKEKKTTYKSLCFKDIAEEDLRSIEYTWKNTAVSSCEDFFTSSSQPLISSTLYCLQNFGSSTSPIRERARGSQIISRKQCLQSDKALTNSRGNFFEAEKCKFIACNCRLNCKEKLNLKERENICQSFWSLGHWQSQTLFIVNNVKLLNIKRRTINGPYGRNYHREFYLNNKRICKTTFLSTLCISNNRLDYAIRKKNKNGFISPDKRGGHPYNKTPNLTKVQIFDFLNKFPKFKSHYLNSQKVYFHPELTVKKIHQLYIENMKETNNEQYNVSYTVFLNCFKFYNVGIYVPKKVTCQFCDQLKIQLESSSPECKANLSEKHMLYLQKASFATDYLSKMTNEAKKDRGILCFSFDMKKTQPIPYLNTSVVYYKRQLWLFNLGINTRHDNQGYMCIWNESRGKRGANEVCSSIFNFLLSYNKEQLKRIVSFSDCGGGQYRNRNVVAFMMFACCYFGIESWEHMYLESCHPYLSNDSDFGKIEKRNKIMQNIYTEEDWIQHIEKSNTKKPFKVIKMNDKFLNFKTLSKYLTFHPPDTDEKNFSWLDLKWLRISKNDEYIQYKTSLDPEIPEKSINLSPRKGLLFPEILPERCSEVRISSEKYHNLLSILKHIPPIHHDFFKGLPHQMVSEHEERQAEFYPEGYDDTDEIIC